MTPRWIGVGGVSWLISWGLVIGALFPSVPIHLGWAVHLSLAVLCLGTCAVVLWRAAEYPDAIVDAGLSGSFGPAALIMGLGGLVFTEVARLASRASWDVWTSLEIHGLISLSMLFAGMIAGIGVAMLCAVGLRHRLLSGTAFLLVPLSALASSAGVRWMVVELSSPFLVLSFICLSSFAVGALSLDRTRKFLNEALLWEERNAERKQAREAAGTTSGEHNAKATVRDEKPEVDPVESVLRGVAIALSGGGHRATLFGLGALLYMARAGVNRSVTQISSVSGGSLTNGLVAQSLNFQTCTAAEFDKLAGRLLRQIADRGTLFATWESTAYLATLAAAVLLAVASFVLWARWPAWLPNTWLVPAFAIATIVALGIVIQWRGRLCQRAFASTLFSSSSGRTMFSETVCPPRHIICATEIQTGNGAYFTHWPLWTKDGKALIRFAPAIICEGFEPNVMDFELSRAVQASAALPFAFPAVLFNVKGWQGITRRRAWQTWDLQAGHFPASRMVLADGGVRDNLGVEWFDRYRQSRYVTRLIVVNGAANRVSAKKRRTTTPFLGELVALNLVKDLPYTVREQNRRRELLNRFIRTYNGSASSDFSGAVVHIEESPTDLAEAVARLREPDPWMTTHDDLRVVEALTRRGSSIEPYRRRAEAILAALANAEDIQALCAKRSRGKSELAAELVRLMPEQFLVAQEWEDRAFQNARLPTTLSKLRRDTSAALIRHAFALTMAKLHILFEAPLVDLPSIEEIKRLMDEASPST
jgi:predicted acylesterase/phospholipase RssA